MVPKVFVKVTDEKQVSSLLRLADRLEVQVTFRAAGTSLLGQAITNSVLFLFAGGWTSSKVQSNGDQIVLEPGAVGSRVNDMLNPLGRKIDPDPANTFSIIGGIAANNASGMCCGVDLNSYCTLHSMRVILTDGQFSIQTILKAVIVLSAIIVSF
jgi:D-lactate dehydrogenase